MSDTIEKTNVTRVLSVDLTDSEIQALGENLASLESKLAGEKERKAVSAAEYNARIKDFEIEITRVAAIINTGHKQRAVECERIKNFHAGTITLTRLDTGAEVETKIMLADERQPNLPGGGEVVK
ncbi:hypothetical protein LCGC14_1119810 [marine sediment metagenome]|uniref:Uncharacterized protein n=1 Tax=marine sediment metagenome TaxID=412755 RepID=A0A0F9M4C8_9ZZZZ